MSTNEESFEILEHLDVLSEKTMAVMESVFKGKSYPVSKEEPYPKDLMQEGAQIVMEASIQNGVEITGYHVIPSITEHLYLLNVQDHFNNTVADVMFSMDEGEAEVTVESVLVTFKPGAILYNREEQAKALLEDNDDVEGEDVIEREEEKMQEDLV